MINDYVIPLEISPELKAFIEAPEYLNKDYRYYCDKIFAEDNRIMKLYDNPGAFDSTKINKNDR